VHFLQIMGAVIHKIDQMMEMSITISLSLSLSLSLTHTHTHIKTASLLNVIQLLSIIKLDFDNRLMNIFANNFHLVHYICNLFNRREVINLFL